MPLPGALEPLQLIHQAVQLSVEHGLITDLLVQMALVRQSADQSGPFPLKLVKPLAMSQLGLDLLDPGSLALDDMLPDL